MTKFIHCLGVFEDALGALTAFCIWLLMSLVALVVVLRYGFGIGLIAHQELQIYVHAFVFMMAAGFALKHDDHVRVDIFYRNFTSRQRAWVNLCGGLFLLSPMCIACFYLSLDYVALSWSKQEASAEAGGLPLVYFLKSLLLIFPMVLGLSALRQMLIALQTLFSPNAHQRQSDLS